MGFLALVGPISSAEIRLPGMSVSLTKQIAVVHKYIIFLKRRLFLIENIVQNLKWRFYKMQVKLKLGKLKLGSPQTSTASDSATNMHDHAA